MNKFNILFNQIINESYEFDKVQPIFDQEANQLVDKVNNYFKSKGLQCYFTLIPRLYFSDGYRMQLKFNPIGDKQNKSWTDWFYEIDGMESENLVIKYQTNITICLKSTWRPQSVRGKLTSL